MIRGLRHQTRLPEGREEREPRTVVERKAPAREIASTEIRPHNPRVGMREIRCDSMDELVHDDPSQAFARRFPSDGFIMPSRSEEAPRTRATRW